MKKIFAGAILGLFLVLSFGYSGFSQSSQLDQDTQNIVQAVSKGVPAGDKDFKVYTSNMARSGDFAYIGVTDGDFGGTYLLKKVSGEWTIIASDGGVFDDTSMIELGVPPVHAKEMWRQWVAVN